MATRPLFTQVTVKWGPWDAFLRYPSSPDIATPVFSSDRRLIFAILRQQSSGRRLPPLSIVTVEAVKPDGACVRVQMKVKLSRSVPDEPLTAAIEAGLSDATQYRVRHCQGRLLHCAAARSIIRDMEKKPGSSGRPEALQLAVRFVGDRVVHVLVSLLFATTVSHYLALQLMGRCIIFPCDHCRFGVACKWASFLVVEPREHAATAALAADAARERALLVDDEQRRAAEAEERARLVAASVAARGMQSGYGPSTVGAAPIGAVRRE